MSDFLEIIKERGSGALDKKMGIEIPEEELKDVKTVGEALDLVAAKI